MLPDSLLVCLINLDRSPERLATMSARLAGLGWAFERVPAVDGRALDWRRLPDVDVRGFERAQGRRLQAGDVGCYLSHLACLRRFLDSAASHLLVLEDDADPEPDCTAVIEALLAAPDRWDVVKLSGYHSAAPVGVARLTPQRRLAIPFAPHSNTAALLLNRAAAQRLLTTLRPMILPYDHALERPWLHGVRLRIVTPPPCRAGDGSESTIPLQRELKIRGLQRWPTVLGRLRNESARLRWALGQLPERWRS
jgi:glycosyl transferase, family 25